MSSTREKTCHVCKEPKSMPTKPLVTCMTCKGKWHQFCHNPKIFDIKSEWQCSRCTKKRTAKMDPPAKLFTAVSICEFPSCRTPIFQGTTTGLCKIHDIQAQYQNANKHKSDTTSKPAPTSKPFNKAKLHPVNNLDDDVKALLRQDKKRKREATATTKRSTNYHILEASTSEPRRIVQPHHPSSSSSLSKMPAKAAPKLDSHRTPEERQYLFNLAAQNRNNIANVMSGPAPKITSPSNAEAGPTSLNVSKKSPQHVEHTGILGQEPLLANKTTQLVEKTSESANPAPPKLAPPTPIEISKLTIFEMDENASPGTQIVQEFRATVENPQSRRPATFHALFNRSSSSRAHDPREQEAMDAAIQKELERSENSLREDEGMQGPLNFCADPEPVATEDIPLPSNERDSISESPALTSIFSSISPNNDVLPNAITADLAASSPTESIEAKRRLKAVKYDPDVLDSFLKNHSRSTISLQPTPDELAKTQIWGHIDPRVKWPKHHSDEWLAEKSHEIKQRGGRKANFGKLLTSQVLKERSDKGWSIHQNKEASIDKEKLAEGAKALEELFGIKDIDELEPGSRTGQFGMSAKPSGEKEKRKRRPKIYPIGY